MPNPPKSVSDLKKLTSAARAIVTYQVWLPFGYIREALREADRKLEAAGRRFRDGIFEACYETVDLYGNQSDDET